MSIETGTYSLADGNLSLDVDRRVAILDGREVRLTPIETRISEVFGKRPDYYHYQQTLADTVWGYSDPLTIFNLKVRMHQLSRKLGQKRDEYDNGIFSIMRGFGYSALSSLGDQTRPWPEDDNVVSASSGRVKINIDGFSSVCDGYFMRRVTRIGANLLNLLAQNAGWRVDKEKLCFEIWGKSDDKSHENLQQHIYQLRQEFANYDKSLGDPRNGVIQNDRTGNYRLR